MRWRLVLVLLLVTHGSGVVSTSTPSPNDPTEGPAPDSPRIVSIYPNPALEGDRGEFVVVFRPGGKPIRNLTLADGETSVGIPASAPGGRVAVATDPSARNLTDARVLVVAGPLHLANGGERLALEAGGRVIDSVTYPRAPEGAVYRRTEQGWHWQRLGATAFPVRSARADAVRVFVLPDGPAAALAPLRAADRRLWLAGYTLTFPPVVDVLCAARARGVDARVLVELEPVGGMASSQARLLDRLDGCGVEVRVIGGARGRYAFHHAKYAVADDRAVVLTENWKPARVGERSSRGWGVGVSSSTIAVALAETFEADAGWRDARPWAAVNPPESSGRTEPPANGSQAPVFTPTAAGAVELELLVARDNAEARLVDLSDGATAPIRVIQVSVGGPSQPFVRALVRGARRGVTVRLLLADAWYVREHNAAVSTELNALARAEGLPLRVRLATPRGRYEKIHAKGAVVDGRHVMVESLNWNNASARRNRVVVLVHHDEAVGRYYEGVFRADWQSGRWRVPAGIVAVVAGLAAVGGLYAPERSSSTAPEGAASSAGDDERYQRLH